MIVDDCRAVCFIFERSRAPRHFLWQRAPYEEIVNFYWSISRAPRQWQGATEAIAFVASVKYQACDCKKYRPNALI